MTNPIFQPHHEAAQRKAVKAYLSTRPDFLELCDLWHFHNQLDLPEIDSMIADQMEMEYPQDYKKFMEDFEDKYQYSHE